MKSLLYPFFTLAAAIIVTACTGTSANQQTTPDTLTAATEQNANIPQSDYTLLDTAPSITDEDEIDTKAVIHVLRDWDNCHRTRTTAGMDTLYSPVCLYYGADQTSKFIVSNKKDFFAKHPQYTQYIDSVEIIGWGLAFIDITFNKHVRTANDASWQTYKAYLRLIGSVTEWTVSWESDTTTDANLERRNQKKPPVELEIDNTTTLAQIFNDENVGKLINTGYWELVGFDDNSFEGPLAKAIMGCNTIGARNEINGILRRGLNGDRNTLYVGGTCSGGPYTARVLWIYNKATRSLSVYPEF